MFLRQRRSNFFEAKTLEQFYFKANLGARFEVGLTTGAFCQWFCASFKMTLKINQERGQGVCSKVQRLSDIELFRTQLTRAIGQIKRK